MLKQFILRNPENYKVLLILIFIFVFAQLFREDTFAQTIYVATTGSDKSSGDIIAPLKTIGAALKKIDASESKEATLYIRKGRYNLSETLSITNNAKQIKIIGYKGENIIISGGMQIKALYFSPVENKLISQQLTSEARKNVVVVNLRTLGLENLGNMNKTGYGTERLPSPPELFIDNTPLTLARWPNKELLKMDQVIQKGKRGTIANTGLELPIFKYAYNRPERWKNINDIWISGNLDAGWSDDALPIKSIDLNKKVITLKEQAAHGITASTETGTTIRAGDIKGYFFYNILAELDSPGEWYLDRVTYNLFVWPPKNINNSNTEISLLETPMIKLTGTSDITIENINFSCTRGTIADIKNSKNILINNCTFSNSGNYAITALHCTNFVVNNSKFSGIGASAITLDGGERKELIPSNNIIQSCEFVNYARLYKSYSPAITLSGVGNIIKRCYIHDSPCQAIIFSGNNHQIVNNIISNTSYGFNDIGAIYTGRDPSSAGTNIQNNSFLNIQGNNNNNGVAAIYIDDVSGGNNISRNFFYNSGSKTEGGFGAIHINGGANNKFDNNIFMNCGKAFSNSYWKNEQWEKFILSPDIQNKLYKVVNIKSNIYLKKFPYLRDFFDLEKVKERKNLVNNSVCINLKTFGNSQGLTITNTQIYQDFTGFVIEKKDSRSIKITKYPQRTSTLKEWNPIDFDSLKRFDK